MNELIPIDISPVKLFTEKGLDPILKAVEKKVDEFEPDVKSGTGRKEIASFAYKITQSKTFIEKAGKELVSKQKAAIKLIDTERKRSRDFLDEQRDRARLPLTEWEEAEKKLIAEEAEKIELSSDHTEALEFHALWLKEKELEALKAKIEKEEEEKRQAEEAVRLRHEREDREEIRTQEAIASAKKDAEKAVWAAEEKAAKAETERIAAEQKAEYDKKEAVQREKNRAKRFEEERLAKEAVEKTMAERKALHHKHRKKVEGEAMKSFVTALRCQPPEAIEMVKIIKNNEIKNVTLNY